MASMELTTKRVVQCAEMKAMGDGTYDAVLSTAKVDRDGESLAPNCFEPLPASMPFLTDHIYKTEACIGSMVPRYEDGILKALITFSSLPKAQEMRVLVDEQHLKSLSVSFYTRIRKVVAGVPTVLSAELVEASLVIVPANVNAMITGGSKSVDPDAKALDGSYEHLTHQLQDALNVRPERSVHIRGTYPDRVIYERYNFTTNTYEIRSVAYSIDETGAYTFGEPETVTVVETIVTPKSAADPASLEPGNAAETDPATDLALALAHATKTRTNTTLLFARKAAKP